MKESAIWRKKEKGHRRPSGYKFFMKLCIMEIKQRLPDASIYLPTMSQLCAEKWGTLDNDQKAIFQAHADNKGVEVPEVFPPPPPLIPAPQVAASMRPTSGEEQGKPKLKKPTLKKITKCGPKRPLSSFVYFCKDERSLVHKMNPHMRMGEVSQVLSKLWTGLSTESKSKYEEESLKDRKRYNEELALFKQTQDGMTMKIKQEPECPDNAGPEAGSSIKMENLTYEHKLMGMSHSHLIGSSFPAVEPDYITHIKEEPESPKAIQIKEEPEYSTLFTINEARDVFDYE